jgi:hypothetical protein
MRAIEAASDLIYREQPIEALDTEQAATQRRADALALLAERGHYPCRDIFVKAHI